MSETIYVAIRVADAGPEGVAESWISDLTRLAHIASLEEFGPQDECKAKGFSQDTEFGRAAFAEQLSAFFEPDEIAEHLAQWDEAHRPIAVIHLAPAAS